MDEMQKTLRKMNKREREAALLLVIQLQNDYTKVPDLQKIQGKKGMYRARIGNYRIIISIDPKTKEVMIMGIRKRNESTYKNLSL
jgi:mRNA-degrading endonuclease RelE of RelBE toxin-antitoxin system